MLIVICGEDITASRNYLQQLKNQYVDKEYEIQTVPTNQLEEIYKNSTGVMGLFGQQTVYIVENLSSAIGRKKKGTFMDAFNALVESKDVQIIDWEGGKSAYNLTSLKKLATGFTEFKPEKSIFQLLDECYPGNLKRFLNAVNVVGESQEDTFIYAMLCKHIRNIILAKENALGNMSPWQKKGLLTQAKLWPVERLIAFYDGLARIDISQKTNGTPFDVKKSMEVLSCYYLA